MTGRFNFDQMAPFLLQECYCGIPLLRISKHICNDLKKMTQFPIWWNRGDLRSEQKHVEDGGTVYILYFESQSCTGLICGLCSLVPCLCPWPFQLFQKEMQGILQEAAPERGACWWGWFPDTGYRLPHILQDLGFCFFRATLVRTWESFSPMRL